MNICNKQCSFTICIFSYFHYKLTINKFVQFTYSCALRVSKFAPAFSEPSMIFFHWQEHNLSVDITQLLFTFQLSVTSHCLWLRMLADEAHQLGLLSVNAR